MATRTVVLAGELGRRFGREHQMDVSSPAEAIRALCANYQEFADEIRESESKGLGYRVIVDKRDHDAREIHIKHNRKKRFVIVPTLIGAKGKSGGIIKIVVGAILLVASFFIPGSTALLVGLAAAMGSMGFGLIMSGVSQLVGGTPKGKSDGAQGDDKPSYFFSGPVNTISQGGVVPVGYGEYIVGSAVISAGLATEEYPLTAP